MTLTEDLLEAAQLVEDDYGPFEDPPGKSAVAKLYWRLRSHAKDEAERESHLVVGDRVEMVDSAGEPYSGHGTVVGYYVKWDEGGNQSHPPASPGVGCSVRRLPTRTLETP